MQDKNTQLSRIILKLKIPNFWIGMGYRTKDTPQKKEHKIDKYISFEKRNVIKPLYWWMTIPINSILKAAIEEIEIFSSYNRIEVMNENKAAVEIKGVTVLYLPFLSALVK